MIALTMVLLCPVLGFILMTVLGGKRIAGSCNIIIAASGLIAAIWLAISIYPNGILTSANKQFYVDAFSILSILLTTFIVTTTAIFSRNYMWHNVESKRISLKQLKLYHVMYQLFSFMMLLALTTNNIGVLWVAMEGATLATVLLVSLYRTPEAVEAAWKYFILCIVGIALALFGTVLIYFSAGALEVQSAGIFWSVLYQYANKLDPAIVKFAFVFLLIGYGTKIGLVPLHNWLPDAHSESPAPMSTLLSGLLLNVALYALVRFKILVNIALNNNLAGMLMMGFGLLSFVVAAIFLNRQRNIKRMFSYSSIEHMGLMTFAFGLGNWLGTFAALFYMLMHSLTKSAIFVAVGNAIQIAGTQDMQKIRGLIAAKPMVGWGLLIACVAISGFPPFGIFNSEIMLFLAAFKLYPWITVIILLGLLVALAGLFRNMQPVVFGEPELINASKVSMLPAVFHLGLVLVLGVYLPVFLQVFLQQATQIITVNFGG